MGLVRKLKKLISIPQVYDTTKDNYKEMNVVQYLKQWNPKLQQDEKGNLYLINPGTPLLCAHMDTRQTYLSTKTCATPGALKITNGILQAYDYQGKTACLGADDKCGIAIAMQIYDEIGDEVSLLFTVGEESGLQGARYFLENSPNKVKSCLYCIIPDRMNDTAKQNSIDIIGRMNNYCSMEFQDEVEKHMGPFGYKPARGVSCDADVLNKYINCINVSCGYLYHHTDNEQVNINTFVNAYNAIFNTVISIQERYPTYEEENNKKATQWKGLNNRYKAGKSKQKALPLKDDYYDNGFEDNDDGYNRGRGQYEDSLEIDVNELVGTVTINHDAEFMSTTNQKSFYLPRGTYWYFKGKEK